MTHENFKRRSHLLCLASEKHLLSPYLDDELDAETRARVAKHLMVCARCHAEFEQLRFASNAMAYFRLPDVEAATRNEAQMLSYLCAKSKSHQNIGAYRRHGFTFLINKVFASSISVPTPLAIGVFIVMFASLFYAMRFASHISSASDVVIAPPPTKVIELPIEREVAREHIVTRTVYVERPHVTIKRQKQSPVFNQLNAPRNSTESIKGVSLAGFRPAPAANLRIVKESEQ